RPEPQPPSGDEVRASVLSDSEASTYFGSLLTCLDQLDAAEGQITQALHAQQPFAGAFTAMGVLRIRQNRNTEALPFLERAVQEDANNPLAHFHYAEALESEASNGTSSERKTRLDLSRVHLRRAIALAPWFVEAYGWLGYVTMALDNEYDAAEVALHSAI